MIRTRFTELAGVDHPIVLGGMGSSASPELVAAVSGSGRLGIRGATAPVQVPGLAHGIRRLTRALFGMNPEDWIGREGELHRRRVQLAAHIGAAREPGDATTRSSAGARRRGLIDSLMPAADVVTSIIAAEAIVTNQLSGLLS